MNMLPTFATNWLSPRLSLYPFERRGFSLDISTTQDDVDLAAGVADAGIWYGDGQWVGLQADLLFEATIDLYARPGFATGSHRERLQQVARANLFVSRHCLTRQRWMESLPGGPFEPAVVTRVDSGGLTMQAAADGAGVSIAVCELAESTVRLGRPGIGLRPPGERGRRLLGRLSRGAARRPTVGQPARLAARTMSVGKRNSGSKDADSVDAYEDRISERPESTAG